MVARYAAAVSALLLLAGALGARDGREVPTCVEVHVVSIRERGALGARDGREVPTGPLQGTWKVIDIVEGGASGRGDFKEAPKLVELTVKVAKGRLTLSGPVKEEAVIRVEEEVFEVFTVTGIDPTRRPATIDFWSKADRVTYRGIYQRQGKWLYVCIQFWMSGPTKASERPRSFEQAWDRKKNFGPMLLILEQK
jgi:uncharacterized protein (TIGR03067 family)